MSQEDRLSRIQDLVQEIVDKAKDVSLDDIESSRRLAEVSRRLSTEVETAEDAIYRILLVQPALSMAVRTAVQMDLFSAMDDNKVQHHNVKDLAERTGADPALLVRLMRQMAAMEFIRETGPDSYDLTHTSRSLAKPSYRDPFFFTYQVPIPTLLMTPQFLAETKFANPSSFRDTPLQLTLKTKQTLYDYFENHPELGRQFSTFMSMLSAGRPNWDDPGHFPVREFFGSEANIADDKSILLVDIGGSKGHDLIHFRETYPDLRGRLILQDLPEVIQHAGSLPHGIEGMAYNFFTPQPVKGARAYYLHQILHAFPDDECLTILRNLTPALQRGYSKILLNEIAIPPEKAHYLNTTMDLVMMVCNAAEERTEAKWEELLAKAGLKVCKVWRFEVGSECIIEAELA